MVHLPQLIVDLGVILMAAGITTLLFKKIRQPLVLGYIMAGLLVGPHFSLFPTVADENSIKIWAEIGVIFLLFNLGLEFSFKKLAKVGGAASITAVFEVAGMLLVGYFLGAAMGWNTMDSIFLGGILSISSTTIIIRAFEELGVKQKRFAGLVFGVLIVEDLVAILLLVLLSTLAISQQFAGIEMLESVVKLGFFLILWFLAGIFLVPTFLKKTQNLMNDETMLIVSIGLCILMVILATQAGFSPALGAFIMGSILAETTQAERIENLTKSVKDLFAAIFFVSVGMMIEPAILYDYAVPVLLISLATILGKFLSSAIGALISGQPLKIAVQSGMSLAQIGEFSFIIATLGLTLKVTSDFLYPIAVAVSAITTFTTPYLIKLSSPFNTWLERTLPARWIAGIDKYSSGTRGITTMSDWKILLSAYVANFIIHSVILISIIFLASNYIYPFLFKEFGTGLQASLTTVFIAVVLMAPFIWAMAIRRIQKLAYSHLWLNKRYSRGPLVAIEIFRVSMAVLYLSFLFNQFFDAWITIFFSIIIFAFVFLIFSQRLQAFYHRLENRFILNLNERDIKSGSELVPWDTHLAELHVEPESVVVGMNLQELAIREKYGINVAMIERGKIRITTPGKDERIYPGDRLKVIGTDEQLASFQNLLSQPYVDVNNLEEGSIDMQLQKLVVSSNSPLSEISILNSGIREKTQGLVIGVERNSERILNPGSAFTFKPGDIVWIVGNPKKIRELI